MRVSADDRVAEVVLGIMDVSGTIAMVDWTFEPIIGNDICNTVRVIHLE